MTKLRRYDPGDRAACQSVFFRAVREGTSEFYDEAQRKAWAASDRFDPSTADRLSAQVTWLAIENDDVIGFMSLREDGYLDMAYVLPHAHGCGVADALYARIIDSAQALDLTSLFVDGSHFARRFFTKHGWQVDYQEEHPARGQVFDRFRMTVTLRETTP